MYSGSISDDIPVPNSVSIFAENNAKGQSVDLMSWEENKHANTF
jgi:hypothetical protein